MNSRILLICWLLLPYHLWAQPSVSVLQAKLEQARSDSQKITAYNNLVTYYSTINPDSAEYFGNKGLEYAIEKKYLLGEGEMMEHLGIMDKSQGEVDIARKRIAHALEIYRKLNYLPGVARMTNSLGAIEAGKGNYAIAIKYFIASLRLHDSLTDNEGLMLTYLNLGGLYMQHDDTANAFKYLVLAKRTGGKMPLMDATISVNNTLGVLEIARGDSQKGLQIFLNDLELSDKPQFVNSHVECLSYLGQYYLDKGQLKRALQYLNEGLKIATEKNLHEMQANILVEIGQIMEGKDPRAAMDYLDKAKEISQGLHDRAFLITVYEEIASLYKQQKNYKEALDAIEQKQKLADSIFNINKAREITGIGAEYEFEKSKMQLDQLEMLSNKNAKERNVTTIIAGCVTIFLIVLLFYFRKTIVLNRQLVTSKQELKDLNAMKDKLFSVIGHDLKGPIAIIPSVIDIYEDPRTGADEKKFIHDNLKEHARVSLETLDKLLYWGQSLVKGNRIRQVTFDPKEYIEEAIEFKKIAAAEKHIVIMDAIAGNMKINADPTHFDFIIRNLLANAIKYTYDNGRIEINADSGTRHGFIIFMVKDNGTGMDKEVLSGLFRPLNSKVGTANEKGNGIGLMLCKEFAVLNGGDIWVESEEGKGATFFFSVKNAA